MARRAQRRSAGTGTIHAVSDPSTAARDKALGRFYTPRRVARLALALAVGPVGAEAWRAARIWDPTCGDGGFLRPAADLGGARLVGHDVDGAAVAALRAALPSAELHHADLFDLDPSELGLFDAIAGNPPYVRHERMEPTRQRAIIDALSRALDMKLPGGADLSLLALLQCLRFLAPGGRLAFVLPCTFLDLARTAGVRSALLERFSLRAVVESRRDSWFDNAAVNTVIAVFERGESAGTVFAQLDRTDLDLAPAIDAGRPADGLRCRTVQRTSLRAAKRWSTFLRAPDVWFEVLERGQGALVAPERVLRVAYGTKPGISAFFAPRDAAQLAGVEPDCLRPFLRSLKHVDGYVVREAEVDGRLFAVPPERTDPPPGAARWILRGEQGRTGRGLPWPQAPSARANKPWWRLAAPRTGALLIPQFRAARHHVIDNPDRVLVNNSAWWGAWEHPDLHAAGVALLNTSWMALAAEVLGRVNLGEGLLTLYGPEIAALPLPDPRRFARSEARPALLAAWGAMRARPVLPFLDEVHRSERHALDDASLRGLDLDRSLGPRIRAAAATLMAERLTLAQSRR